MVGEWSSAMMLGMCFKCGWNFPRYLIRVLAATSPDGLTREVCLCPICMLQILNQLTGRPEDAPYTDPDSIKAHETATQFLKDRLN